MQLAIVPSWGAVGGSDRDRSNGRCGASRNPKPLGIGGTAESEARWGRKRTRRPGASLCAAKGGSEPRGPPVTTANRNRSKSGEERCRDWSPAGGGQRPGAAPLGPAAQPHSRRSHQDHRSRGAEPDLATCRVTEPLRQLCGRTSPLAFGDRGGPRARAPDMAIHMRGPGASDSLRRLGARAWHSLGDLAPRALGLSAIFLRPIGDFRHIFGD